MLLRMPIDQKSLYLNIKNDNETGHTPTVATPLRQGSSVHIELAQILKIPESIPEYSKGQLSLHILSKSRAEAKIVKAFLFDKISVNGIPVDTPVAYCIYIREETDPGNVHCGRQKVHYPQILEYEDNNVAINNQAVIRAVSAALHDYAFIVQAFEYDVSSCTLNFDVLIVGNNGVPYSKVFVNKRGVGDKFASIFNEYADIYDSEIIAMRSKLGYDKVNPDNFMAVMADNKEKAINAVLSSLNSSCTVLSTQYPYSLYDIEVTDGTIKKYYIVRFTSTKISYFSLSNNCIQFINSFPEQTEVVLVSDVNGSPCLHWYNPAALNQMKKTIGAVTYESRGVR